MQPTFPGRLAPVFSAGHPLGADQLGRDMLSRIVWGTRVSLAVGLIAAVTAAVIGSTIGIVAGFCGRWVDGVLMRAIDMLMAFPYLLLALAIVAALVPACSTRSSRSPSSTSPSSPAPCAASPSGLSGATMWPPHA